jgi:F-type H+-transporting ATPase subunit gamma
MPANLKDLRSRIKSVKNTQQITKAMKLVSSAKFGRAQQAVIQARPYAKGLAKLTGELLVSLSDEKESQIKHPLMSSNESRTAVVLVLSSERGLCGGFNANMAKQAVKSIEDLRSTGFEVSVICFGKKAYQVLAKKLLLNSKKRLLTLPELLQDKESIVDTSTLKLVTSPQDKPTFESMRALAKAFETLFESGAFGKLVCNFSKFQSALVQEPMAETFLPVVRPALNLAELKGDVKGNAKFEPSPEALVDAVLPRYLATQIFQSFLESVASEHGARMTAMDNATRNGRDMEKKLQVTYQRARQAAITNELIEIISGAEAM